MKDKYHVCKYCNSKISRNDKFCLNCGKKIKFSFFKKYSGLLKTLVVFYIICISLFILIMVKFNLNKNSYYTTLMKNSKVLEIKIGKIDKVKRKSTKMKIDGDITYEYFVIITEDANKYDVAILFNKNVEGIYAYEINGELIYEVNE